MSKQNIKNEGGPLQVRAERLGQGSEHFKDDEFVAGLPIGELNVSINH